MGTYAVTGGSSGIGAKTVNLLKQNGHEVLNIDLRGGDITADLSTPDGRQHVIDELHRLCPDGLDGLVCNAGVSGACVVTSSNTISQGAARMDIANLLNNNNEDEQRILNVIGTLDESDLSVGNSIYVASKYALARWVRRHSASYAANGVRINAVAPGNVNTTMTATLATNARMALNALPIPTKYGLETLMDPEEIAAVIVFLASDEARGVNGNIMFVDGGTDALLNTEKVY
ncbi:SDR family oxidoreductase [Dorea sp.]